MDLRILFVTCTIFCVNVVGKYFDEISQDSGRYCFGVQETLKALEMGAVEILIVWENMEVIRYVLKNNTTTGKSTLCFKKTGTLFISFIIHSNDDQFTRNFCQM